MNHLADARLAAETLRLLEFARAAQLPSGGFGWLDERGRIDSTQPLQLWINARMTHVWALASLLDVPGARALCEHGLAALQADFHDDDFGGWFSRPLGTAGADGAKNAYEHSFVIIAASSASVAGLSGAPDLLSRALDVVMGRFWEESAGACRESWDRQWRDCDDYRGANANMHMTEAFLSAADATEDPTWRDRALRIAKRVANTGSGADTGRLTEHYDSTWRELPDYNEDQPRHQFRPYGVTPGHGLEWSRLLVQLHHAHHQPPAWLLPSARNLYARAVADGWDPASRGFVYTTDAAGRPVVRDRFHWVVAEAIAAASSLSKATGEHAYSSDHDRFWEYADTYLIDRKYGSWRHELSPDNRPQSLTWSGKPDSYHAVQATLIPRLPLGSSIARGIRQSALRLT